MVSLISQNAKEKGKRKTSNDKLLQENEETNDRQKSHLDSTKTSKRIRERMEAMEEREMKKLENFLFGSIHSPVEFGNDDETTDVASTSSALFFTDRLGSNVLTGYDDAKFNEQVSDVEEIVQKKPVLVDEQDDQLCVNIAKVARLRMLRKDEEETVISGSDYLSRLRAHHVKLNPGTEWAQLGGAAASEDDEDSEGVDDVLRASEDLVVKSSTRLLPGLLGYSRLVNVNAEDHSNCPINSVQFHSNAQLFLTAGLDKKLRLYQIDGKQNTRVASIFLDDCPIRKASFLPDGSQVIIAGRRKFFYSLDLVKGSENKIGPLTGREEKSLESFEVSPDSSMIAFLGNEGYILLVSSKTNDLIGTLKMNGTVRSVAYTNDGQQLLSSGGDGQIYHWDLRRMACIHKGVDEGCITGTALCTSPVGNLFAAGSDSGIVNIYNRDEFLGGKRKPLKTIENLTTRVDVMKFNKDAQILAICSRRKKSSLKLIHIPSFTVFSNWPPLRSSLYHPCSVDFSPGGGFMAMGNADGDVLLYKLHHYPHA